MVIPTIRESDTVIIIDDVLTTGNSIRNVLEKIGDVPKHIFSVVGVDRSDREINDIEFISLLKI